MKWFPAIIALVACTWELRGLEVAGGDQGLNPATRPTAEVRKLPPGAEVMVYWGGRGSSSLLSSDYEGFTDDDWQEVLHHVKDHPDLSSYLLIGALIRERPLLYKTVVVETRAKIFCAAIESLHEMNGGWGHLRFGENVPVTHPGDSDWAMKELITSGRTALPLLVPLLTNKQRAYFSGSADSNAANLYHYRRCDYACAVCAMILEEGYVLQASDDTRDAQNEVMARRIRAVLAIPTTRP